MLPENPSFLIRALPFKAGIQNIRHVSLLLQIFYIIPSEHLRWYCRYFVPQSPRGVKQVLSWNDVLL